MNKSTIFVLLAVLFSINLISCDGGGGGGKGEEQFTVFDVVINIDGVEGDFTDCPDSANLKLSTQVNENNISGFAELIAFGNTGEPVDISGPVQDSNFSLDPFSVGVSGGLTPTEIPRAIYLNLNIAQFDGAFSNYDVEMSRNKIEGIISGDINYSLTGGPDCIASFTGEFSGGARSPQGCVSPVEAPTLECPAEGFVNQCEQYDFYFCYGWCDPPDPCVDFFVITSECEVVDCLNVSCPLGPVDLEGLDDFASFEIIVGDRLTSCVLE